MTKQAFSSVLCHPPNSFAQSLAVFFFPEDSWVEKSSFLKWKQRPRKIRVKGHSGSRVPSKKRPA
jgi:hypothetical protein